MEARRQKGSLTLVSSTLLAVTIILKSCMNFTNAVEASISADQVALWGSTVNLSCTLQPSSGSTPSQILWYKSITDEPLPSGLSQVVGNSTSLLTLSVVTNEDTGTYYCALPSDGDNFPAFQSSRVTVGKLPARPTDLKCYSRDSLAFWCTWQSGGDSYLGTNYTFQYIGTYELQRAWRDCPDYDSKGEMSCYISALSNMGQEQRINITATNALGSVWRVSSYNPNKSTIPHPPANVRAEVGGPREIQARWDIPLEWKNYMSSMLSYRLRIWEEGSDRDDSNWREIPSQRLIQRGRYIQASFHVIHNLQPGSHYNLQAACKYRFAQPRGECWSNWSLPVEAQLPALTPSGTVNDLDVTEYHQVQSSRNQKRDALLRWEPVPFNLQNGPVVNYTVSINVVDEDEETRYTVEAFTVPVPFTTYQLEGLSLHKEYEISISACNSAGCGPNATAKLENLRDPIPLQPIHLRVLDLANQSLMLIWNVPDIGGQIDHYLLQWLENQHESEPLWEEVEIPGGEYVINSPPNPATYSFRVQAFNSLQQAGPWSRTLSVRLDGIELTQV